MEEQGPKRHRRPRYKGTHPKNYKEKYKEHDPEKYKKDVEKVIKQGRTPAGMHRSICVDEIIEFLDLSPGQIGLDATLGYGGHALEILKRISPGGKLYATDVDPIEMPKTIQRLAAQGYGPEFLIPRQMNFAGIDRIVEEAGPLDFVLADLGVSSMQIDNPDRGFSFKVEGPLDLRLNPVKGKPVSAILKKLSQEELQEILHENSDEPYAEKIANAITQTIANGATIETTTQLRDVIHGALKFLPATEQKEEFKKACQRCFQALRIAVNNEFEVLDSFLSKLPDALAEGGRVAILSFHSGEDRRVKKAFQAFLRQGIFEEITAEPIRPSAEECAANPRAKSAKLRWGVKGKIEN